MILGLGAPSAAIAEDDPGTHALDTFREDAGAKSAVENRFFLKQERFEISPLVGYVPNNPFARRFVGGVTLKYHFSETFGAEAQVSYSPDLGEGDLKGLTSVLLDRAYNASTADSASFQQPLDKVTLAAAFGIGWAPIYGKINLVGETVLNFDLYGFAGLGMVSKENYNAVYHEEGAAQVPPDIVLLQELGNEVKVSPVLGIGQNYFLTQSLAFKIDARAAFYVDNKPQYNPDIPVAEQRLYNNFTASAGIGLFFPKMKPRLYNF